ncbi:hypothetical protein EVAR_102292_1 [Eumeta japonica]|uniref:Uncharacterized protein n=1 Tax=Eumeta variegata TaxID=151549 RepID=A0A4C1WGW6_EUMVA|nr:hypothetical protein EVAR_102292_1 [Eumeta japonica]
MRNNRLLCKCTGPEAVGPTPPLLNAERSHLNGPPLEDNALCNNAVSQVGTASAVPTRRDVSDCSIVEVKIDTAAKVRAYESAIYTRSEFESRANGPLLQHEDSMNAEFCGMFPEQDAVLHQAMETGKMH